MIEEKKYTAKEISIYCGRSGSRILKLIRDKLQQKSIGKNSNNEYLFSSETFKDVVKYYQLQIIDFKKIQMYYPFRIETVYHIYESKMNNSDF